MTTTKSPAHKGQHLHNGGVHHSDGSGLYAFGRWRFDGNTGDLCDGEATTRLEPQVAKLLEHFLTHQHTVISRDELMAAAWKNRIVSDDAINRCISILRQILTPEDKSAYIETVVRKGYLAHFPPAPITESRVVQPPGRRKYLFLAVLAGAAAIFLYLLAGNRNDLSPEVRESQGVGAPTVAVLPFVHDNQSGESAFFADGVHDDLLTQLAKLQSIRVISSTSVREYRNTGLNVREIGQELGADAILEGRVQIAGDQIRINAQLIDTRTDEHLWAESYDRELSPFSLFDVQSEIAQAIAEELNTALTAQDRAQLALIPTENMAAYRAYHRAMQLRAESNAAIASPEYLQALEEAVELDPKFARAWAQLVNALAFENFSRGDPELTRRIEQALHSLQGVAPGSAEHLTGQAAYVYYVLKDYDKAHAIISQALMMSPGDIQAMEMRLWIERRQGDFEANLETRRELRRLDPRNPAWTDVLLHGLLDLHRYDEAWSVVEASSLESFTIGYVRRLLEFRGDRDFQRFRESIQKLCKLYVEPDCGWEVYIANRDYPAAWDSLDPATEGLPLAGISENTRRRIFTHWLMGAEEPLAAGLPGWRAQLEEFPDEFSQPLWSEEVVSLALLDGVQGDFDQSEQRIKRWLGPENFDWARRIEDREKACRVLGMIAATTAAVKCIQDGLGEASHIMEFFEPYLPFYDPIRDQPEFIGMLAEFEEPARG